MTKYSTVWLFEIISYLNLLHNYFLQKKIHKHNSELLHTEISALCAGADTSQSGGCQARQIQLHTESDNLIKVTVTASDENNLLCLGGGLFSDLLSLVMHLSSQHLLSNIIYSDLAIKADLFLLQQFQERSFIDEGKSFRRVSLTFWKCSIKICASCYSEYNEIS